MKQTMDCEHRDASKTEAGPNPGDIELFTRFAELVSNPPNPTPPPAEHSQAIAHRWESSLKFIKDVGERLRDAQRRSEQVTSDAYEIARKAVAAMQEERERANHAETVAADAIARAKAAESEVQYLRLQIRPPDGPSSEIDKWVREAHFRLRSLRRD